MSETSPPEEWAAPSLRVRILALGNVGPLLRMIFQTNPFLAVWSVLCRLLRAILPVAQLYIAKLIIDRVVSTIGAHSAELEPILLLLLVELALTVGMDLAGRAGALCESLLGDQFANRSNIMVMRHAATLDLAQFENAEFQEKLIRARQNAVSRAQLASQLVGAAQDLTTFVILAVGLIVFSPVLLLLLIVALIPSFLSETHYAALGYSFLRGWTAQRRALEYVALLGTSPETAAEVKIFGLGPFLSDRYRNLADAYTWTNRRLAVSRAASGGLLGLFGTIAYYAGYVVIVYRTLHGSLSVGDMTFLVASLGRARRLIDAILGTLSATAEQALYLADFFDFFRLKPRIQSAPTALAVPRTIAKGIAFRNVTFRYPGAPRNALERLSFEIRPGEKIALVGDNGAGKTTLVKLLARLYEPTEGEILLDGRNLQDYELEDWWKTIGVIFQDFVRYNMTLAENIGVGRVESMDDRSRIRDAAEMGLASSLIARLPGGLDQMIGRRFPGGIELSGGEWQKVALSRAFVRRAHLVVLDEPTAALDADSERQLFERFEGLTRGRMTIVISHRFSTVRKADRVFVLADGRLRESGSHEELMRQGGQYAALFRLQSAAYA